jgi:hypothetical protein
MAECIIRDFEKLLLQRKCDERWLVCYRVHLLITNIPLSTASTCMQCNNASFLQITTHRVKHISVRSYPIRISVTARKLPSLTGHKMHVSKFHVSKSRHFFFLPVRLSDSKNRSSPKHILTPKRRLICKYEFYLHFQCQLITPTTSLSIVLQLWITPHYDSKNGPHWTWIKMTDKIGWGGSYCCYSKSAC